MDLVNDLSSEIALAVFVEGSVGQKLDRRDAKSFITILEAELDRISSEDSSSEPKAALSAPVNH